VKAVVFNTFMWNVQFLNTVNTSMSRARAQLLIQKREP
jgi:hypothetical protein